MTATLYWMRHHGWYQTRFDTFDEAVAAAERLWQDDLYSTYSIGAPHFVTVEGDDAIYYVGFSMRSVPFPIVGESQLAQAKRAIGDGSAWQETDAWWLESPYITPA